MSIIDELRSYRVGTDLVSWHPVICDRAADYITNLLARAEAAEAENVALRKIQPVQLDDTGAQALALAAEVSELKQNLSEVEMVKNAAISDLKRIKSCAVCRYCDSLKTLIPIVCQKCRHGDKWEWRGQKEE